MPTHHARQLRRVQRNYVCAGNLGTHRSCNSAIWPSSTGMPPVSWFHFKSLCRRATPVSHGVNPETTYTQGSSYSQGLQFCHPAHLRWYSSREAVPISAAVPTRHARQPRRVHRSDICAGILALTSSSAPSSRPAPLGGCQPYSGNGRPCGQHATPSAAACSQNPGTGGAGIEVLTATANL